MSQIRKNVYERSYFPPQACKVSGLLGLSLCMKKIALLVLVLCLGLPLRGQEVADSLLPGEQVPSGRGKGYQNSITLSGTYLGSPIPITALDFSHGYRFNQYHYVGGGAALILPYIGVFVPYLYTQYRVWWFPKRSTPYASLKLGYIGVINNTVFGAPFITPDLGWEWGLTSGGGISLSLGMIGLMETDGDLEMFLFPIPILSLTFRFQ